MGAFVVHTRNFSPVLSLSHLQYSFLVGLILIIEVVGAVLAVIFRSKIESKLQEQLRISLDRYYMGLPYGTQKKDAGATISLAWDYAQVLVGGSTCK